MTVYVGRIQLLAKPASEWAANNPVLLNGEFGVQDPATAAPILKVGDGVRPWSVLPEISGGGAIASPGYVVGSTVTLPPGSFADVVIDNTVTPPTISFAIPTGDVGPPNTLAIGTTTTGAPGTPASATITGAAPNQTLNLTIPMGLQGPQGDPGADGASGDPGPAGPAGPPNVLTIGTTTTGAPGSAADATITGTSPAQVLNLTIPQGPEGPVGPQGPVGPASNLADATGTIGLTTVVGVATSAMRSDASPALSQAIVPTWTGAHTFTNVLKLVERADPGLAAADQYWLTARDDSGITRAVASSSRAQWVINQDNYVIGRNVSGATIPKMRGVRAVGGSANRPTLGVADSSVGQTAGGVTAFSVADNGFVEVITIGVITAVDTSAWAPGTRLYLGAAGVLTSTPPAFPAALQLLGVVLDQHAVNGSVYIARTSDVRSGITAGDAFANPSGTVGLTAVNGSAVTIMRSDAAPALNQAIAPTWTGNHIHRGVNTFWPTGSQSSIRFRAATDATADANWLNWYRADGITTRAWAGFGSVGVDDWSIVNQTATGRILFLVNGSTRLTIDTDGTIFRTGDQARFGIGTEAAPPITFNIDTNTGLYLISGDRLGITTGGARRLDISNVVESTVPIMTADGTAALPGYTFGSDGDTGFFRQNPDEIRVATGGALAALFQASTRNYLGGAPFTTFADGTAAAPGITFEADQNTGMYRLGTDELGFATGGGFRGGFFSGGLGMQAGSAIAPSHTFWSDTNTGMYSYSADVLGLSTGGGLRAILYSAALEMQNGCRVWTADGDVGTPGFAFALDTDTGIYRNAANNDARAVYGGAESLWWSGGYAGSLLPFLVADGVAGAPALTFRNDTDTGIYRITANMMAFSTGGTRRAYIYDSGFVPEVAVRFLDGTAASPSLTFDADVDTGIYRISADRIGFAAGGSVLFAIGTASGQSVVSSGVPIWVIDGTAAVPAITFTNDPDTGLYLPAGNVLGFTAAGAEVARMSSAGVQSAAFTSTSSRAIKRETGAPRYAADILARLRPILYRLLAGDDREQLGLIAEEVHAVCPQLSDGQAVAYDRIALLLLADWQERHAVAA